MQLRIYRANKNNNGAASKIEFRYNDKDSVKEKILSFWTITQQTGVDKNGNASFAWEDNKEKTITFKLGPNDIGEILATINGRKKNAGTITGKFTGIYHQNKEGNTVFNLERKENGYNLNLSRKRGDNLLKIHHIISDADAELLRIFLWQILRYMYTLEDRKNVKQNE